MDDVIANNVAPNLYIGYTKRATVARSYFAKPKTSPLLNTVRRSKRPLDQTSGMTSHERPCLDLFGLRLLNERSQWVHLVIQTYVNHLPVSRPYFSFKGGGHY